MLIRSILIVRVVLHFILKLRFNPEKSVADILEQRYGTSTLRTYRTLERKQCKLLKAEADVEFLTF